MLAYALGAIVACPDTGRTNRMWWKLLLAYLLALPAVLWFIYRSGQALGQSQRSIQQRDFLERRRH